MQKKKRKFTPEQKRKWKKHISIKIRKTRAKGTIKLGKQITNVKTKHIKEGYNNQIILKYKSNKKVYEVSVIVRTKKSLQDKLKLLNKIPRNSGEDIKVLSVHRYLAPKRNKRKK